MGETYVTMIVHGSRGSTAVEALADTAATFSKIPASIAAEIGLEPSFETQVELGDGRVITRRVAIAEVEIDGVRRPVPVAFSENDEQALIGYTTLEIVGFKVDVVSHQLEKRTPIEY